MTTEDLPLGITAQLTTVSSPYLTPTSGMVAPIQPFVQPSSVKHMVHTSQKSDNTLSLNIPDLGTTLNDVGCIARDSMKTYEQGKTGSLLSVVTDNGTGHFYTSSQSTIVQLSAAKAPLSVNRGPPPLIKIGKAPVVSIAPHGLNIDIPETDIPDSVPSTGSCGLDLSKKSNALMLQTGYQISYEKFLASTSCENTQNTSENMIATQGVDTSHVDVSRTNGDNVDEVDDDDIAKQMEELEREIKRRDHEQEELDKEIRRRAKEQEELDREKNRRELEKQEMRRKKEELLAKQKKAKLPDSGHNLPGQLVPLKNMVATVGIVTLATSAITNSLADSSLTKSDTVLCRSVISKPSLPDISVTQVSSENFESNNKDSLSSVPIDFTKPVKHSVSLKEKDSTKTENMTVVKHSVVQCTETTQHGVNPTVIVDGTTKVHASSEKTFYSNKEMPKDAMDLSVKRNVQSKDSTNLVSKKSTNNSSPHTQLEEQRSCLNRSAKTDLISPPNQMRSPVITINIPSSFSRSDTLSFTQSTAVSSCVSTCALSPISPPTVSVWPNDSGINQSQKALSIGTPSPAISPSVKASLGSRRFQAPSEDVIDLTADDKNTVSVKDSVSASLGKQLSPAMNLSTTNTTNHLINNICINPGSKTEQLDLRVRSYPKITGSNQEIISPVVRHDPISLPEKGPVGLRNKTLKELQQEAIRQLQMKEKQKLNMQKSSLLMPRDSTVDNIGHMFERTEHIVKHIDKNSPIKIPAAHQLSEPPRKKPKHAHPKPAHAQKTHTRHLLRTLMKSGKVKVPHFIQNSCPFIQRTKECEMSPREIIMPLPKVWESKSPRPAHSQRPFGIAGQLIVRSEARKRKRNISETHSPKQSYSLPNTPSKLISPSANPRAVSASADLGGDHFGEDTSIHLNVDMAIPHSNSSQQRLSVSPYRAHRMPNENLNVTDSFKPQYNETIPPLFNHHQTVISSTAQPLGEPSIEVEKAIQQELTNALAKRQRSDSMDNQTTIPTNTAPPQSHKRKKFPKQDYQATIQVNSYNMDEVRHSMGMERIDKISKTGHHLTNPVQQQQPQWQCNLGNQGGNHGNMMEQIPAGTGQGLVKIYPDNPCPPTHTVAHRPMVSMETRYSHQATQQHPMYSKSGCLLCTHIFIKEFVVSQSIFI